MSQRVSMFDAPFSRRRLLEAGGGLALIAVLGGCGGDDSAAPAELGGDLNLFVWEGYDKPADMATWLKQNDITLNTKYIAQPEEVPTILRGPGGDKWDMSYGDNVVLDYYSDLELLQTVTTDQIPGLAGLLPAFQRAPWKNDDGSYSGIPWTWGFTGLTYRSDRVPEPESWHDLLEPAAKGRVTTIDGALNNVALGSLAVGIDPDELTTAQLQGEVKDYLSKLLGQVRSLAPTIGDQISLLVSGDVDYCAAGLKFMDAETAAKGVETKTIVPKEGAIGWADTTFITADAPNVANALGYANHLLEPAFNAAANSDLLQGPTVSDAIPLLTDEAKAQYPYDDLDNYLSNVLTFNMGFPHEPDGDRATYDQVLAVWEEVKGGG